MEGVIRELAAHVGAADPAAFAYELSPVMEGAHVTRRVTGNNATAAIARRVGARLVELPIPAGPGAAAPVGRVPALYAGGDLSPDRRSDAGLVRASNIR